MNDMPWYFGIFNQEILKKESEEMSAREIFKTNLSIRYQMTTYKGKNLLQWAVLWFKLSNDAFYELYGFNFNPHVYPYLYEIARDKVYKE